MDRRKSGGVPPIVTILIILSFILASVLVGWFIISTTASATRRGIPVVSQNPVIVKRGGSTILYITVRNDGTAQLSIRGVVFGNGGGGDIGALVPPGESLSLEIGISGGSFEAGREYEGVLRTDSGEVRFVATVLRG